MEKTDYLNDPKFDECKRWVQNRRKGDVLWGHILAGGRALKEGETWRSKVTNFLALQEELNEWPHMTCEEWQEFVTVMEDFERSCRKLNDEVRESCIYGDDVLSGFTIPDNPNSFWQTYRRKLSKKWDEASILTLEATTITLLNMLKLDTRGKEPIKGLVIGHVQSGKTANMEALMAMAADKGWNLFIILSGMLENLRTQTLSRMLTDLGQEGDVPSEGFGGESRLVPLEDPSKSSVPTPLNMHFNSASGHRVFTVCLKNTSRLRALMDWIHKEESAHKHMKILIIDDESDQASVSNTAKEQGDNLSDEEKARIEEHRKGINDLLTCLVNDTHYADRKNVKEHAQAINYVMYTATPYANVLNERIPSSLYPRTFIWPLTPSRNYIGPNQIFGFDDPDRTDGLDIKRTIPDEEVLQLGDIYKGNEQTPPRSLQEAVCWFICAVAVWRLWGNKRPVSMLIHTSQRQTHHSAVSGVLTNWLNEMRCAPDFLNRCREVYEAEKQRLSKARWISQMPDYSPDLRDKIRDYPDFDEISGEIQTLLSEQVRPIMLNEHRDVTYHKGLHQVIDNCANNHTSEDNEHVRLVYPKANAKLDFAPAFIIVGGSTLSRGLTIEGLVSTYFLRASQQVDTLMQMGRWFGYRIGYELLPRIWMTEKALLQFRYLSELEEDMREDLRKYSVGRIKPADVGPVFRCASSAVALRLTAHMANAESEEMDFSGAHPQTTIFQESVDVQKRNLGITLNFLQLLGAPTRSSGGNGLYWKGVKLEMILNNLLLAGFSFASRSRTFNEIDVFCDWLKELEGSKLLTEWTVILAGAGKISQVPAGGSPSDSHHWVVGGYELQKVVRSRQKLGNVEEGAMPFISIGALRSLKDLLADVDPQLLPKNTSVTSQKDVDNLRKQAGVENTPLLIIYRIDKDSKPKEEDSATRAPLNFGCDIIGLQICIPGQRNNSNFCKSITVRPIPSGTVDAEDYVEAL